MSQLENLNQLSSCSSGIKNYLESVSRDLVIKSCLISAIFIVFIWGFWDKGVYALGINATVFYMSILALILTSLSSTYQSVKESYLWFIPSVLMAFSFVLYENPFIKFVNIFAFPALTLFFLWFSLLRDRTNIKWGRSLFNDYTASLNYYLAFCIPGSFKFLFLKILDLLSLKPKTAISIMKGLLPLILAYMFLIPILSSADSLFGDKLSLVTKWLSQLMSMTPIYKFIVFLFIASVIIGILALINETRDIDKLEQSEVVIKDSISSAIFLGGVLILYVIFIFVQIERLWVTDLPINFAETERYVKTGFWQLFFVSLFNLLLSYSFYGKTSSNIRYLLGVFNAASLLMLFSSAQRLGLYVFYYGFSYEKFYASYTVLYCACLLGFLVYATFSGAKKDPVRFGFYLLLYMYSLVTILPVEKIVFNSNIAFAQASDSRIELSEMRMLSIDVASSVKQFGLNNETDWLYWEQRIDNTHQQKQAYEYTLSDLIYRFAK